MIPLLDSEIRFIKETHWTPTIEQCDEWYNTIFTDETFEDNLDKYNNLISNYSEYWHNYVYKIAKHKYGVDIEELYDKCVKDEDEISLEYDATYLFYIFFSEEKLKRLSTNEALEFLLDFKYYNGYRKFTLNPLSYVKEAIEIYQGERVFYLQDKDIWNIESDSPYIKEHPEKIINID